MVKRRTPRPPMNKKLPVKMLGSYTGVAVDRHHVDLEKLGQDLYDAGYNAISIFLTTCFHNIAPVTYPWPLVGDKFNFAVINKDWQDWLYKVFETFAYYRIKPHIAFVDQFHEPGDNKGPDPFRQGLFGNGGFDPKALYDSLTFGPTKFWWLKWDDVTAGRYTNFKTIGIFGAGMENYIDAVIETAVKVRDLKNAAGKPLYPDFCISWKWANETYCIYNPETHHVDNVRGDRDEIVSWIDKKWKDAGFIVGTKYRCYFDYFCRDKGAGPRDPYYPAMKEEQNAIFKRYRAFIEIHGVLDTEKITGERAKLGVGIQTFIENGIVPGRALFSTDGDMKMAADYPSMGHSEYNCDLKLDTTFGKPTFQDSYQKFWNAYFPGYVDYVD